jgi:hypothetical protein
MEKWVGCCLNDYVYRLTRFGPKDWGWRQCTLIWKQVSHKNKRLPVKEPFLIKIFLSTNPFLIGLGTRPSTQNSFGARPIQMSIYLLYSLWSLTKDQHVPSKLFFCSRFPAEHFYISLLSHTFYMPCPSHSPWSDFHSFINGCTTLYWGPVLFQFRNVFYTDGKTPWTGDQPVARPLPTQNNTKHRINVYTDIHTSNGIRTHDPSVRATAQPLSWSDYSTHVWRGVQSMRVISLGKFLRAFSTSSLLGLRNHSM